MQIKISLSSAGIRLIYEENREDVTNSTLSLPSGEDEHIISCVTEPATYPGRIAPVWFVMSRDNFPHSVSADGSRLIFNSVFTSREQEAEYMCKSGAQMATVDIAVSSLKYGIIAVILKLGMVGLEGCVHHDSLLSSPLAVKARAKSLQNCLYLLTLFVHTKEIWLNFTAYLPGVHHQKSGGTTMGPLLKPATKGKGSSQTVFLFHNHKSQSAPCQLRMLVQLI